MDEPAQAQPAPEHPMRARDPSLGAKSRAAGNTTSPMSGLPRKKSRNAHAVRAMRRARGKRGSLGQRVGQLEA